MAASSSDADVLRQRVAVCLAGLAPAVVTETLYALGVLSKPPVIPERVYILTTEDAYPKVVAQLLGNAGAIELLRREYRLPPRSLACASDDVILLRGSNGKPLRDIRTSQDSRAAGEAISQFLGSLRRDPRLELHCSIAGGRKTMGALLTQALQLIARPGDRLYHVLVNDPFDRIPDFFYPTVRPRDFLLDGRSVSTSSARIELAELPMVRLGALAESLGLDNEDLILRAKRIEAALPEHFERAVLEVTASSRAVVVGKLQAVLPPRQFVLYAMYAQLRSRCPSCPATGNAGCALCHPTDTELFDKHRGTIVRVYRGLRPFGEPKWRNLTDFGDWLRQTRSRVNRTLRIKGFPKPVHIAVPTKGQQRRRGIAFACGSVRVDV
jgi:CRISPR-associated protein (TIGR02584 family)